MEIIELIKVIILGIVEGITEWLPISSTGHMILVDEFIKLNVSADFLEMFLVVIQLGAILAVVVLYWKKLIPFDYKNRWRIKKNTFSMLDENGNEVVYDVLFTFESEETHKNYLVYTDNTTDENGNIKVYASIFDPDKETSDLLPIETEREWKIIETILEEIQAESKKQAESSETGE